MLNLASDVAGQRSEKRNRLFTYGDMVETDYTLSDGPQ